MAGLQIFLLGSIQVHCYGHRIPGLEASKPGALLAYLAVESAHPQARQILAELLWPDRPEQEALGSLRFALSNLRTALDDRRPGQASASQQGEAPFLLIDRRQMQLNPRADVWVDVWAFRQQASACEAQMEAGRMPGMEALQAALRLYRGSFLQALPVYDSLAFEHWVLEQRAQLDRQWLCLQHWLATGYEQAGQYGPAEAAYRAILTQRPVDEDTHRRLMRLLDGSGQRVAALAQYEVCCQALRTDMGVDPEGETIRLYQAIKGRALAPGKPEREGSSSLANTDRRTGTPFVARQYELASLEAALERALTGQGQVALVTGEAGSGKTALVSEFARRALDWRPDLLVVGGRCNAYSGLGQPYLPFVECLQMLAGEWDTLPWAASLDQAHEARLRAALLWVAQTLVESAPALLDRFIGRAALAQRVGRAPGTRPTWLTTLRHAQPDDKGPAAYLEAGALFEQITHLLVAVSRHGPLVLLLDDLQWVDPGSTALLFHLARRCAASRMLIVVVYRSGEMGGQAEPGEHPLQGVTAELRSLPGSVQIDLDQCDERAFVAAYLEKDPFLQPHRLGEDFSTALARHTGGNPLFIAELLRNLQVNGSLRRDVDGAWVNSPSLNWQRLPERIEAAIAGRIARLPAQWIDWLSTASVEGESFTAEVLARVHGLDEPALLRALSGPLNVVRGSYRLLQFEGLQWLGEQRLSRYRFRHILFQTFLYKQMDPAERSRRHAAVGQALEALYAGQVEQPGRYAPELALHFEAAGLAERAAAYWLQAGEYALQLLAAPSALASYQRGLSLLDGRPATHDRDRLAVRLNMGVAAARLAVADWGGAVRGEALRRALALQWHGSPEDDVPELFPLLWAEANWLIGCNEVQQAIHLADQTLALAGERPGLPLALACCSVGVSRLFIAEFPTARNYLERSLALYEAAGRPPTQGLMGADLGVTNLAWLAYSLAVTGCTDQAWEMACQARRRAEALGRDNNLGLALILSGEVAILRGDLAMLQAISAELLQLGQQQEISLVQAYGLFMRGEVELLEAAPGSPQALVAVETIQQGIQLAAPSSVQGTRYTWLARLARACLKAGQIEGGLETVAAGLERSGEARSPGAMHAELYRLRGDLLLAGPAPQQGEAEAWLLQALEASRQAGALLWELRAALSLARTWQAQRPAEARSLLGQVYGRFTEGWGCPDLREARAVLNMLDSRIAPRLE